MPNLIYNGKRTKKPDLYILVGVSGSGKSTWTEKLLTHTKDLSRVSRDGYRRMMAGPGKGVLSSKEEQSITELQEDAILYLLTTHKTVIIDDTNLRISSIDRFLDKFKDHYEWAHVLVFDPKDADTNNESEERVREGRVVPSDVIKKQKQRLQSLIGELGKDPRFTFTSTVGRSNTDDKYLSGYYSYDNSEQASKTLAQIYNDRFKAVEVMTAALPPLILSDLDGTIAWMGDRSPYRSEDCEIDDINPFLFLILACMYRSFGELNVNTLIFVSGRTPQEGQEEGGMAATHRWLKDQGFSEYELYMRKDGDSRPDHVIKKEILDKIRADHPGRSLISFDDRHEVVDMWRENGVFTFDCNQQRARF